MSRSTGSRTHSTCPTPRPWSSWSDRAGCDPAARLRHLLHLSPAAGRGSLPSLSFVQNLQVGDLQEAAVADPGLGELRFGLGRCRAVAPRLVHLEQAVV